uniref:Transposase n=1 Tax=Peronospora matthiolae TaxID=2874970 RepID=A0AAV1V406_9STRA
MRSADISWSKLNKATRRHRADTDDSRRYGPDSLYTVTKIHTVEQRVHLARAIANLNIICVARHFWPPTVTKPSFSA